MLFLEVWGTLWWFWINHPTSTVPTFNSCTKCVGSPGILHNRTPDWHPVSWVWIHGWPQNWSSFDSQTSCVINVFGLFFDILSMGFYTTRHWQTSGRLVQELDVCTVVLQHVIPEIRRSCWTSTSPARIGQNKPKSWHFCPKYKEPVHPFRCSQRLWRPAIFKTCTQFYILIHLLIVMYQLCYTMYVPFQDIRSKPYPYIWGKLCYVCL